MLVNTGSLIVNIGGAGEGEGEGLGDSKIILLFILSNNRRSIS
jgi:hypothetical protein